jgi:hypothetical protein
LFDGRPRRRFAIAAAPPSRYRFNNRWVCRTVNLTKKHQLTDGKLKPMNRIFKNMRTRMWEIGIIGDGVAPSYFIEGLLYNAPEILFDGNTLQKTVERLINFAEISDATQLVCANYQHWLVRDGLSTSWPTANYKRFVSGLRDFWTVFES